MYDLRFTPQAQRYFKKLREKPLLNAFRNALLEIADNPYLGNEKKGDLRGVYGWDVYYAKTNYEIAYTIQEHEGQYVIIVLAGTRENFYEQLKRYVKA